MIFLTGAPASGKTTLGRALAARLSLPFIDLDEAIVQSSGRTIPEIFAASGESYFRDLEARILAETIRTADGRSVIALGGGTLLREDNRVLAESTGTVLCLDTPTEEELAARLGAAPGSRPLGNRAKDRAAHYASFPNRVAAFFEAGASLVVIGRGVAAPLLQGRPVVADETVARLWGQTLPAPFATIPSGERHKTLATVSGLWSAFAARGLGRRDCVVAVGGGVTGDLTGFAAATWMRGMDWINVPTTLLSMVDASTGGKTGCDLPEGKNLAGAFHFPRLVIIDVDFLTTLSAPLVAAGRAEMIKHEVIGGLARDGVDLTALPSATDVARNLMVKVGIVREDPEERLGRRLLLNCGHTVAHAVEKLTDYRVTHGEAVAIGCVEEARLAVRVGLAPVGWPEELAARFAAAGLPTVMPEGLTFGALVDVMKEDKKRQGTRVTFALPCGWGDVRAVPFDLADRGGFGLP